MGTSLPVGLRFRPAEGFYVDSVAARDGNGGVLEERLRNDPAILAEFARLPWSVRNSGHSRLALRRPNAIPRPADSPQSARAQGSSQGVGSCEAAQATAVVGGWARLVFWGSPSQVVGPRAARWSAMPPGRKPTPSSPMLRAFCPRFPSPPRRRRAAKRATFSQSWARPPTPDRSQCDSTTVDQIPILDDEVRGAMAQYVGELIQTPEALRPKNSKKSSIASCND